MITKYKRCHFVTSFENGVYRLRSRLSRGIAAQFQQCYGPVRSGEMAPGPSREAPRTCRRCEGPNARTARLLAPLARYYRSQFGTWRARASPLRAAIFGSPIEPKRRLQAYDTYLFW